MGVIFTLWWLIRLKFHNFQLLSRITWLAIFGMYCVWRYSFEINCENIYIYIYYIYWDPFMAMSYIHTAGHSVCWWFGVSDFQGSNLRILHSAAEDNSSPFDSTSLCQSNKYTHLHTVQICVFEATLQVVISPTTPFLSNGKKYKFKCGFNTYKSILSKVSTTISMKKARFRSSFESLLWKM